MMKKRDPSPTNIADEARSGRFDVVLDLLPRSKDVDVVDEHGGTALIYAIAAHNKEAVEALLQHGASPTHRDHDGRHALHYAILWSCDPAIVVLLVDAGAKVDEEVLGMLAMRESTVSDGYADRLLPVLRRVKPDR